MYLEPKVIVRMDLTLSQVKRLQRYFVRQGAQAEAQAQKALRNREEVVSLLQELELTADFLEKENELSGDC